MTTLTEQYRRHRAEALHTNIAPQGNSTMTDAQMRDLVTKTIDEKLGKPIKDLADQAKAFKKMKATVAALEQQQIAANAAERCTLPE